MSGPRARVSIWWLAVHDIGPRRAGFSFVRHSVDGLRILVLGSQKGYACRAQCTTVCSRERLGAALQCLAWHSHHPSLPLCVSLSRTATTLPFLALSVCVSLSHARIYRRHAMPRCSASPHSTVTFGVPRCGCVVVPLASACVLQHSCLCCASLRLRCAAFGLGFVMPVMPQLPQPA